MFELTDQPLASPVLRQRLVRAEAGACVVFEGWVRNHHLGRPVERLEYEAFDALTRSEGEAITLEAEQAHPGCRVLCVHRTGVLEIGELAVWIGVTSAHRQDGFAACRQVIEELKLRLPIWKKEHHPDGAAEWVNCSVEAAAGAGAEDLHARQQALPEVGAAGQARLGATRMLIVGVGGLGCPAALYLSGAGVGQLTLVDGGKVELSNLQRQILFTTAEVGSPKVLAAAARLRQHNPGIRITGHAADLTPQNARPLVAGCDVVLDCTDNFTTRFLLHEACLTLGVPLVQAAVHRFEGTLDVFRRGAGGCLHCLWPGRSAAELDATGNCAGGPVFGPAVGVLGVMQAAEAIKLVLGREGDATHQTRLVNLLDGTQLLVERPARPDCPVCSPTAPLQPVGGRRAPAADADPGLDAAAVAALGPAARRVMLIEPGDNRPVPAGLQPVAADDLARLRELAAAAPLVLACRHGLRSTALARLLRAEGWTGVYAQTAPIS